MAAKKMKCVLRNKKSKLYFAGYIGNTPKWVERFQCAKVYFVEDVGIVKLQARLLCQSQTVELIAL